MNFSLLIALLLIAMNAAATVPVCDVTPDENVHFNSPFRNCAITDPEDACIEQDQDSNLIAEGNNRLTTPIMVSQGGNIMGDVNGDGEVNISDVNAMIDFILSSSDDPIADVNGDGEINISDVNEVISIILSGN